MLTRLRVRGFKNLVDLDARFGAFTCIAGPNGVGKSNVFDAIAFLAALARVPLLEAAQSIRAEGVSGDVLGLFTRYGDSVAAEMRLTADIIIPELGIDELGQQAKAGITFVRYDLTLGYRAPSSDSPLASLSVLSEKLEHINRSEARAQLPFPATQDWRDSVLRGRRGSPYISTEEEQGRTVIKLHADAASAKGGGRARPHVASTLPRTVLSSVNNALEHHTAVLVRREMIAWTQLHLEPSALRAPDPMTAPASIAANGAHLPATLYALEKGKRGAGGGPCERVAGRLAELVDRVDSIAVEKDERRLLLELVVTDRNGTAHFARALSDGTLRFLALAVLEQDPAFRPLLCLEEPENGIHPARVPAMLELLGDIAVDTTIPVGDENPFRQVLINTHSPAVVGNVAADDLLVAELREEPLAGGRVPALGLSAIAGSWRAKGGTRAVAMGKVLEYFTPAPRGDARSPRILDHPQIQTAFAFLNKNDAAE